MGRYTNNGSDHLRGVTWNYTPRSSFAGTLIDAQNRKMIIIEKGKEYKEKNPEASPYECVQYGKNFVNREKKHFRKYLKGYDRYWYKGGLYLVEDESRLESFIKFAQELEEKYSSEENITEISETDLVLLDTNSEEE